MFQPAGNGLHTLGISYYVMRNLFQKQSNLNIETAWIHLHLNTMTPRPLQLALKQRQAL